MTAHKKESPADSNGTADSNGKWFDAVATKSLAEDCAVEVVVEGQVLAIFRSNGSLFAIDGMCAHQGGPIAQGEVEHGCVTCPWHGWQYELDTGIQTINRQPLQQTFDVREQDGMIQVQLSSTDRP